MGDSPPLGDYGEAPDAGAATNYPGLFAQASNFPSLFANNGARVLNVDGAVIGITISAEVDANDPADPDGATNFAQANALTECDGTKSLYTILQSIPSLTRMGFSASVPVGNVGGTYFVNILIDLDMDGNWGGTATNGESEWVVQNQTVTLAPGQNLNVTTDWFTMTNGNRIPAGAWGRLALTSEQITEVDWDGSGAFTRGEIEDFVVPGAAGEGDSCPSTMQVSFDKTPPIYDANGDAGITFMENVHPADPSGANYNWTYSKLLGTVDLNVDTGAGFSGPGGAPCTPPAGTERVWMGPRPGGHNWASTNGALSAWRVALTNIRAQKILAQTSLVTGQTRQEITEPFADAFFVTAPHGLIEGSVDSSTGEPLQDATVSADISIPGSSGIGGFFSILAQAGPRVLTIEAPGHETFKGQVIVNGNQTTRYNVVLLRK